MPPRCSNCGRFMRQGMLVNLCDHCEEVTLNFLSMWLWGGLAASLLFHHYANRYPRRADLDRWEDDGGSTLPAM